MRVAVVGGSGFVGRYVVRRVLSRGFDALNVDLRPPAELQPRERTAEIDLEQAGGPEAAARGCGAVDGVVWLAATITQTAAVGDSAERDAKLMVEAPIRFLEALPAAPRSVVLLSSIEVYGRPLRLPVTEDHPTDPFTSYGVAKLCAEHYLRIWCAKHGVSLARLRVAFIYGPGQHEKNVIPRFIAAARRGEPPTVFGTGSDVRDDVFVDDVAEAAERALVNAAEGVFNVASGRPHTLLEVAETVCAVADRGLRPVMKPAASGWVDRWYSFDRARELLGCSEPRSFADGIRAMWQEVAS